MGSTFDILWGEIKQSFPNLSPFLAKRFIQRSVQAIYNSRQWSFLQAEGILFTPPTIQDTTGLTIVQFSNVITADSNTILNLSSIGEPPARTKRQIRFNDFNNIYNIVSFDDNFASNGLISLDRPVLEASNVASGYSIFRCYYGPPQTGTDGAETTDFLRYTSIYNPALGYPLTIVQSPRELLNRKDPQRSSQGSPYYLYTYKGSSDGTPQFELWPHPTSQSVLLVSYQRLGTVPTLNTDTLPIIISDELVLLKAMYYGCLWANANKSHYDDLKNVNWLLQAQQHKKDYSNFSSSLPGVLERTQIQDEETFPQSLLIDNRSYGTSTIGDDETQGYYSIDPN